MPSRRPVWNIGSNAQSFYEWNKKGQAVRYHSVQPGESVSLLRYERDRLMADGGWTDKKPQAVKATEAAEKEAQIARIETAKIELALMEEKLESMTTEGS
ncbi:MAG: hypothetical protein V3U45_03870 [bacterium]